MISTVLLGKCMIWTGITGLGLMFSITNRYNNEEYVFDRELLKKEVNSILPNNAKIYFIAYKSELNHALSELEYTLSEYTLKRIRNHYKNKDVYGLSYYESKVVIIFENVIRESFNDVREMNKKMYITTIHEVYHSLFRNYSEKMVRLKAAKLYADNKDKLPILYKHCDEL